MSSVILLWFVLFFSRAYKEEKDPMGLDTVDKNFSTIILFLPCDYFMDLVKIHVDHFQCVVNNFFILKWSVPALNSFN